MPGGAAAAAAALPRARALYVCIRRTYVARSAGIATRGTFSLSALGTSSTQSGSISMKTPAAASYWLVLLFALPPGALPLKYIAEWCHIGCTNITTAAHSWANLAMPKHGNANTTDSFWLEYRTPSLLPMPEAGVFTRSVGLTPGWQGVLENFASDVVLPRLANHTAIGVFLGASVSCIRPKVSHVTHGFKNRIL